MKSVLRVQDARNTLSDISAYHRRLRTLQQVHFSIGERTVGSPAEFIGGLLRHRSGGTPDRLLFRRQGVWNSNRMLAPRPTKLCSQRGFNLWPFRLSLLAARTNLGPMSEKLHELVKEINDLLEAKKARLKGSPAES